MVPQSTPAEAAEILRKDPEAVYLDVRTEGEFVEGHPPRAYNVPVIFFVPPSGQPSPNPDFRRVVEAAIEKDVRVIVGCKSGGRSQRAAEILQELGYRDVVNMRGGFGGMIEPSGRVVETGWKDCGLPVEDGNPSGRSYEDLKAKA